jgi:two-component system LytT family response regulator
MKTRVLIVDDEPIARRGIRRYLAKQHDIEVVGEAANGITAVEQINELQPDIVFLDVQMPDLDGFGVIENVEPSVSPAPVYVFVTAHDAHAIRAFEVHAVDYLLKPYDKERFARALVHSHLLRDTLAHLEEKLAPHHFIRVRKSAIVNGACISEIRPMFEGVYDIILAGGTVVTSSRRYAHKLRALLES